MASDKEVEAAAAELTRWNSRKVVKRALEAAERVREAEQEEEQIEAAAKAIRNVYATRIGSGARSWEELNPFERDIYREEGKAALIAADMIVTAAFVQPDRNLPAAAICGGGGGD